MVVGLFSATADEIKRACIASAIGVRDAEAENRTGPGKCQAEIAPLCKS